MTTRIISRGYLKSTSAHRPSNTGSHQKIRGKNKQSPFPGFVCFAFFNYL